MSTLRSSTPTYRNQSSTMNLRLFLRWWIAKSAIQTFMSLSPSSGRKLRSRTHSWSSTSRTARSWEHSMFRMFTPTRKCFCATNSMNTSRPSQRCASGGNCSRSRSMPRCYRSVALRSLSITSSYKRWPRSFNPSTLMKWNSCFVMVTSCFT